MRLLWLDDMRNPFDTEMNWVEKYISNFNGETIWAKNYYDFVEWITENGLPDIIAFDHDLGCSKSGHDAAKWLIDYCIDNKCNTPDWVVQSSNPPGRENIDGILTSFKKFKK